MGGRCTVGARNEASKSPMVVGMWDGCPFPTGASPENKFRFWISNRRILVLTRCFCRTSALLATQSAVLAIVKPSVRLSVTRWHCANMTHMQRSWRIAPWLVSWWLTSARNSNRNIGSEGAEWERGRKNRQFLANKTPYVRNGAAGP